MASYLGAKDTIKCYECKKYYEKKNKPTPCKNCQFTNIINELNNEELYIADIANKYIPIIVDGMGGIQANAIIYLQHLYNLNEQQLLKLITYVKVYINKQLEDNNG